VFGTKRSGSEAAQEVPAQISAFDSSQLDALQVVTIEDLSFSMPNVSLDQIGTFPGVANFSIRGFGINSSTSSVDPAVGLFIDGVYNGVNWGSVVDTFDLESVEVFRGPQGVLFGRNVTGGAVLMRTARPTRGTA
jgi:iron complex outermembrane recepter protein